MEAIDTVMSGEELRKTYMGFDYYTNYKIMPEIERGIKKVRDKQAEISFKAGRESREDEIKLMQSMIADKGMAIIDLKSLLEMAQEKLKTERKEGRKEVVEWIENRGGSLDGFREEWQAFKKKLEL